MNLEFLFIKTKDDFCQNINQFKSLLSSNTRLVLKDNSLEADHLELSYKIVMYDVTASREVIFHLYLEAKQKEEENQVLALEKAESLLKRINDQVGVFQINTIRDDVSLYYGEKLYPLIAKVEMVVRQIIYLFMLKNVGSKWSKEQSPDDVKKAILNTVGKNQPEGISYPDTDVLVYADFITLGYFFFSKYSLKSNYQELVSELKKKENYTEEKIKDLIELYESKSNWDRYFADKINVDKLFDKWKNLYMYRNMVAHTKKIRKEDFEKAKKIIDELYPAFKECLKYLNSISMTNNESEAIEEVVGQIISPEFVISRNMKEKATTYMETDLMKMFLINTFLKNSEMNKSCMNQELFKDIENEIKKEYYIKKLNESLSKTIKDKKKCEEDSE